MYPALVGLAAVVLFERIARLDEENPFLWSFLAAVAWFVPFFFLETLWSVVGIGALFGVYFIRKMGKDHKGGQVR